MIDIEELQMDIADFLNEIGSVTPVFALDLIHRSGLALAQMDDRISAERERGNRLQEAADLLRDEESEP